MKHGPTAAQRRIAGSIAKAIASAFAALAISPALAQGALPVIAGEPAATPRAKSAPAFVAAGPFAAADHRIDLPQEEIAFATPPARGHGLRRTQIGAARDVDPARATVAGNGLGWRGSREGFTVRLAVRSPGASALRTSITVLSARGLELRFAGADRAVAGPFLAPELEAAARAHGAFWSPVTPGDEQWIELAVPDAAAAATLRLRIDAVSHLAADPARAGAKAAQASGSCQQDVACLASPAPALLQAGRSVAKLVFTTRGNTYSCSATLVNDRNAASQVPYLLTAAHCIDSREEAASVTSFWFHDRRDCGDDAASPEPVQLTRGATLLFANSTSDVSLLRLNEPAPAGAWFAGIDPNPVSPGEAVATLHHPRGDFKKVSSGLAVADTAPGAGRYQSVAWLLGTTEPGSSGAGAFSKLGDSYVVRGTLRGGSGTCESSGSLADPSNRDYFARLDGDFEAIGAYLLAEAAPLEDYADLWQDPKDPGWGVTILRESGNAISAVWFTHDADGEPVWAWISDGKWTSATTFEAPVFISTATPGAPKGTGRVRTDRAGEAVLRFEDRENATFTVSLDGSTRAYGLRRRAP